MKLTATQLRSELYRVLDRVLETGEPVEVERASGTIVIRRLESPRVAKKARRTARGNPRLVVGDPDELVHFDWSRHWKPYL